MNSSTNLSAKPRRTILILHPHFTLAGGAGNFVLEVGSRLVKRGNRVIVCTIRYEPSLVAPYDGAIEFIELGGPLSSALSFWLLLPWFIFKVIRVCDKLKPDIVFPQVFPANWWGFIYKLLRPNCKLLWMCQEPSAFIHSAAWIGAIKDPVMGFLLRVLNPVLRFIDLRLAKHVDFVLANSQYGQRYASEVYGYSPKQLDHVYLGVNTAFSENPTPPDYNDRKAQIVTICRLTKFKNVDLIIDAVKQLHAMGMHAVELKIVGRGEEEHALKDKVLAANLGHVISFCGAVALSELVQIISSSRAFVLASVDEPFGLAVVEAMACGTPAVVVESGGPSEIVKPDVSGYHVPALDINALCQKLALLLNNEELFNRLSRGAKLRSATFDWEATTDKIETVINQVMMSPKIVLTD